MRLRKILQGRDDFVVVVVCVLAVCVFAINIRANAESRAKRKEKARDQPLLPLYPTSLVCLRVSRYLSKVYVRTYALVYDRTVLDFSIPRVRARKRPRRIFQRSLPACLVCYSVRVTQNEPSRIR